MILCKLGSELTRSFYRIRLINPSVQSVKSWFLNWKVLDSSLYIIVVWSYSSLLLCRPTIIFQNGSLTIIFFFIYLINSFPFYSGQYVNEDALLSPGVVSKLHGIRMDKKKLWNKKQQSSIAFKRRRLLLKVMMHEINKKLKCNAMFQVHRSITIRSSIKP